MAGQDVPKEEEHEESDDDRDRSSSSSDSDDDDDYRRRRERRRRVSVDIQKAYIKSGHSVSSTVILNNFGFIYYNWFRLRICEKYHTCAYSLLFKLS